MSARSIYTATLFLFILVNGASQNVRFVIKKEKLSAAKFITDIAPGLWDNMILPEKDRSELDYLKKATYAETFIYSSNYNTLVNYISVEIVAICSSKKVNAFALNDKLTEAQRNILSKADVGTDIIIKVKFKHKGRARYMANNEIIEGYLPVNVVPYTEAEFLNGTKQVEDYLSEKIFKIKDPNRKQPPIIKFTISEEGKVINAKITQTSNSPKTDKILLEATTNMPKWKPAKNSKGVTVKQEFCIQLGGG
ncbi:MAG: hypothetical protein IPJ60_04205 [Sphingobacteriaceae bacterium]|nr:hypothetical protein [Sphingobacteriaceae bacterium]